MSVWHALLRGIGLIVAVCCVVSCGDESPATLSQPATSPGQLTAPAAVSPAASETASITAPLASTSVPNLTEGAKIDVGGYKLFLKCTGAGSPTVVLDSALPGNGEDWAAVQPSIARTTRVCSYDRAGEGRSQRGPRPRTSLTIVGELHALLTNAQVAPPYVLAGHSFGGFNVRLYASRYPDEVVGMVLVDSSHQDQRSRFLALLPPQSPADSQSLREFRHMVTSNWTNPDADATGVDFEASATQVRSSAGLLGDRPLAVLTSGKSDLPRGFPADVEAQIDQAWLAMQDDLARLSSNSVHVIAKESGHYIQEQQPALVIAAIEHVVVAARTHGRVIAP